MLDKITLVVVRCWPSLILSITRFYFNFKYYQIFEGIKIKIIVSGLVIEALNTLITVRVLNLIAYDYIIISCEIKEQKDKIENSKT